MSLHFKSSPLRKPSGSRRYQSEGKSDPIPHNKIKNKIAPRSGLQFKVGPPFGSTIQISPILSSNNNQCLTPIISARIDRGFDLIDNEWIGYKRNYFSVVASFQIKNHNKSIFEKTGFYTEIEGKCQKIKTFAIRLVSKCLEDDSDVPLVQHTAKRDRGPQIEPPIVFVIPGILPSHIVIKESANIRKITRIVEFDRLFYDDCNSTKPMNKNSILHNYPRGNLTKVAKYERIQFATSVQHRKPISGNKNFVLQIQLLVELSENTYAIVAISETPPLTVRGRSPSNYTLSKISPNKISTRRIENVLSSPLVQRGSLENENIDHEENNSPMYVDNFDESMFQANIKNIISKHFNIEDEVDKEVSFLPYDSNMPQSNDPSYFLQMTAKLSQNKQQTSKKPDVESFSKDFETHFYQSHETYYKTYIDDSDDENPTISPSLLFTISE